MANHNSTPWNAQAATPYPQQQNYNAQTAPASATSAAQTSTMGWGDMLDETEKEFVLLPEGEYFFTVDHYERTYYNGSEKLPPCDEADVFINVDAPEIGKTAKIKVRFFLAQSTAWRIKQFLVCIGLRKKGQACPMNWDATPGRSGRCRLSTRKSTNGNEYNEVAEWLEPGAEPAHAGTGWQQMPATPTYAQYAAAPTYSYPQTQASAHAAPSSPEQINNMPQQKYQQQTFPGYDQAARSPWQQK